MMLPTYQLQRSEMVLDISWFERTESVFSRSNYTEDCKGGVISGLYVRTIPRIWQPCATMVPDSEKMMEVFIGGLPRSIEENVTASKLQTLEEAINIE
ncbi:hypothetical protein Tco_0681401 [Tanacetum coccineum]|uniref:Uncharacterized protein n=1 Tax=Tanacetum coccineum TaxID=301880 RepID=A0ABQ4XPW7_9ASTR